MNKIYTINSISLILKKFNVKKIVISGVKNEKLMDQLLKYDGEITQINSQETPLDSLPNLKNYDAIFIDDDPNWYTIFNELNIIKNTNENFPLVFICNNKFPNKTRDSYSNPNKIPKKFRQKYTKKLPIYYNNKKIIVNDGFYHAHEENTPKNGVLTGINDFLSENSHIGKMNLKFIDNITILYLKLQINQKRIRSFLKDADNNFLEEINISDKIQENQLLISHIDRYNVYNEKFNEIEVEMNKNKNIINDFKNQIHNKSNELNYNKAHIENIESQLNLRDSQLQNLESKLLNEKQENINLKNELKNTQNNLKQAIQTIKQQKIDFDKVKQIENELIEKNYHYNKNLSEKDNEITSLKNEIFKKENELSNLINNYKLKQTEYLTKINELNNAILSAKEDICQKEKQLNLLKHCCDKQLSKIDSEKYYINCLKNEISNNHFEIKYFKGNKLIKKILTPFAYLYLIFKSKPTELSLNLHLYKELKDNGCFDIGFYLNNNKDLIESKWCKYFSPEFHYVCKGFNEKRKFNKKYFNYDTKEEILKFLQDYENN